MSFTLNWQCGHRMKYANLLAGAEPSPVFGNKYAEAAEAIIKCGNNSGYQFFPGEYS